MHGAGSDTGYMRNQEPLWKFGRQIAAAWLGAAGIILAGGDVRAADDPGTPDKPWSLTLEAGMLNDDSVSIDALDNRSGQADQARVFNLGGSYSLFGESALPIKASYGFSKTSYQDLKAFNLQSHTAFLSTRKKLSAFDAGFLYGFSHTELSGNPFLNFHTVSPTLGHGLTTNWYVLAGYNYQNKTFHTAKSRNAQVNGLSFLHQGRVPLRAGERGR